MTRHLPTPDSYDYEWVALSDARFAPDTGLIRLSWPDTTMLDVHPTWVAENTPVTGYDTVVNEGILDVREAPTPSDVAAVTIDDEGALAVTWSDGGSSKLHPGWLRHIAENKHLPDSFLPDRTKWTATDLAEPISVDGSDVLGDSGALEEWLSALVGYGLARLVDAPTDPDFLLDLMKHVGPIRGSNFGDLFSVRIHESPDSLAYTGLNLGQHTDLPTREIPPGFQFLHCIENTVEGGWSRMTDGLALIDELQTNHADHYEALTTLDWVWFNRQHNDDHRWVGPVIDHGGPHSPVTFRAFYPVRSFPAMDSRDVSRAYAALCCLNDVAHDERFQMRFAFRPGDIVGFDNRRVFHGRDGFDPGGGGRHLRGCYLDSDDILSRTRVLRRRTQ
ncbi:MAG: gamma-butyrobetaine,2-oxoglutarate dioxygenase [Actinomycetia bacterium]|nr:gamma-butyrobetaine,2-oxoglutarate dioxygenase [Actinomycetes bacterium]